MSLILDALRKSEAERRRGEAPGLFTALPAPGAHVVHPRSNGPAWIAAAIIAVAVAAAAIWWQRTPPPSAPVPVVPRTAPAPVVSVPMPPPPTPVAAVSPPKPAPPMEAKQSPEEKPPASLPTPPPAPADAAPVADEPPLEALPTLAALAPDERAALPPLKLSMHVWSEAPNARLAIIDGQRVMEGSAIGESIVAEIRRDGVVLAIHGHRYLLPRP
jgi:general secretion pathway protein B